MSAKRTVADAIAATLKAYGAEFAFGIPGNDVLELMAARAAENPTQLESRLDANMPETMFDTEGLNRAILNIVTNALDAVEGQADARVTVETGHDPIAKLVYVIVTDNGPGIPPAQLPKLFNIFESTKGSRGTGLGLAVSQKILREHGGEITVVSEPNQGAQFTLEWPLLEDERPPELDSPTLS